MTEFNKFHESKHNDEPNFGIPQQALTKEQFEEIFNQTSNPRAKELNNGLITHINHHIIQDIRAKRRLRNWPVYIGTRLRECPQVVALEVQTPQEKQQILSQYSDNLDFQEKYSLAPELIQNLNQARLIYRYLIALNIADHIYQLIDNNILKVQGIVALSEVDKSIIFNLQEATSNARISHQLFWDFIKPKNSGLFFTAVINPQLIQPFIEAYQPPIKDWNGYKNMKVVDQEHLINTTAGHNLYNFASDILVKSPAFAQSVNRDYFDLLTSWQLPR